MVTFYSPYPTASDGQWGATVQGGIATYKFFFEDGTTDGWTASGPGIIPITDLDWNGTVTMSTTGKVGPAGYAMEVAETTPGDWPDNEMGWGGFKTPRFPIQPGDHATCMLMVGASDNTKDVPDVESSCYLDMYHTAGADDYNSSCNEGFIQSFLPGTGPPKTMAPGGRYVYSNSVASVFAQGSAWDALAEEATFEFYVYGRTWLDGNTTKKPMVFRILGAIVTVTTP